jgi:signal transduction histidine kinase
VLTLDPADFERPPSAPLPRIEEVLIDGQPVPLGGTGAGTISVGPRRSQIEIRYTAFQWRAPETLRFRYRIAPLDEAWTEAGEQRLATFRHLPPGNYRFEVTATADGTAWAQPAASLAFVLEPVFWQTAWFRILAWAGGVGMLATFGWKRVRTLEQRRAAQELFSRRLLQSQELERRRIAAELHDSLGQNLVLMKNLAVLDGAPKETLARRAPEIAAAAERALEEVHALSYALRPPELDRLGLAKAIAAMVHRSSEASGIRFESNIEFEGSLSPEADIQLFRIAQEAVNNLMKHSGANTARVELWRDDGGVHLVVSDDGRGLAGTRDKSGSGTGLGLSGIEERVRLLGAQCKWLSQPGHGTTLSLLIPLKT